MHGEEPVTDRPYTQGGVPNVRLFFAIPLSVTECPAVKRARQALRNLAGDAGIHWVPFEQYHCTLKFLGDVSPGRLEAALEAASDVARSTDAFALALAGTGAFPRRDRPQILWAGATEGVPVLTALAESLDRALDLRGFPLEKRRFQPHFTLARIRTSAGATAAARALQQLDRSGKQVDKMGVLKVSAFVLMNSDLFAEGARYTVLQRFPLCRTPGNDPAAASGQGDQSRPRQAVPDL